MIVASILDDPEPVSSDVVDLKGARGWGRVTELDRRVDMGVPSRATGCIRETGVDAQTACVPRTFVGGPVVGIDVEGGLPLDSAGFGSTNAEVDGRS